MKNLARGASPFFPSFIENRIIPRRLTPAISMRLTIRANEKAHESLIQA